MRYSLSNRFRATLIGAAIGQMLVLPGTSEDRGSGLTEWSRLTVLGTQSLIRLGRFDLDNWRDACGEMIDCVSTKAIISTLPLALLYHENEIKLRQNLQLALVASRQDDIVNRDSALAVGYAIAQSLTEKLNVADLIPQTIAFLGPQTQLAQQLVQVQMLLEQRAGSERVQSLLGRQAQPTTPTALAFYYFLSTLEDLRLSLMRAAQNADQPQLTTAITGALSGAYNSTTGIPASLRMKLTGAEAKPLAAWGMINEAEMLKLADSLFAVWSGVYDQTSHSIELTQVAAIAAPQVIRSR